MWIDKTGLPYARTAMEDTLYKIIVDGYTVGAYMDNGKYCVTIIDDKAYEGLGAFDMPEILAERAFTTPEGLGEYMRTFMQEVK